MIEIPTEAFWGGGCGIVAILFFWFTNLCERIGEHKSKAELYGQRLADVFTLDPTLVPALRVTDRNYWDRKTITINGLKETIDLDHLGALAESKRTVQRVDREAESLAEFDEAVKEARK